MKRVLLLTVLMIGIQPAFACLILVVTDGQRVLVGNHEDWIAPNADVLVVPAAKGTYGFLGFAFAGEAFIQGGMNTQGLFFDGTATPFVPLDFGDKPASQGSLWQNMLAHCATVPEALAFIQRYRMPDLERIHVAIADKTGASVVVGAYDGHVVIHPRQEHRYQLLTNFNLSDPSYGNEPVCERYQKAVTLLQTDSAATVANVRNILAHTHQDQLTVYSNIYDLTAGEVTLYQKADFSRSVRLKLREALLKGASRRPIALLFAKK